MAAGAFPFLSAVDLNNNELRNMRHHVLAGAPGSPASGMVYFNSTDNKLYYYNGSTWIDARDRANHTGSQTASTISDFNTAVRTNRLDQLTAPTGAVNFNGQRLTSLATATADTDAVNLAQARGLVEGISSKASVRAASTGNVTLATPGTSLDGVTLVANDRILLKNQTTASQNGIWVWSGAAAPLVRAVDADGNSEVQPGLSVFVSEGATLDNSNWQLTTNAPITLGTTNLTFTQTGAGGGSYTAGNGLTLTGSDFAVGAGTGITVNADSVQVNTTVVVRKVILAVPNAASPLLNHNLGTSDIHVMLRATASPFGGAMVDYEATDDNNVTLRFSTAPAASAWNAVIFG